MDYYKRIQQAISFIEEHLHEEMNIAEIASAACFSPFHFQRLFQAITGFSVHEYIRKRRLSVAADLLKQTNTSVLDIALTSHYNSQEAFTRAFEQLFGITPGKYRKADTSVRLQPKIDLLDYQKAMKKEINVQKPVTKHLDPIEIIGYEYKTNLNYERYFEEIPGFYREFGEQGRYMHIQNKRAPHMAYGISCNFQDDGTFSFIVGEEVEPFDGGLPDGFVHLVIPAGTYAVFQAYGGDGIVQDTRKYIYGTWLPNSNFERNEGPDFEVTDVVGSVYPHDLKITIYIPLKR
ncbi:AraC family transcriptional regulator [Brevibacillus humidisoli]|uniref:AraC family transcriptional regulator n=1 Tax=Brevibacillus humidisoli TaxID=2895522 RepID=UPI001E2F8180|nr:effector binding domain-containing protein [Brevibacillus humidisoli]UFJ41112.1 AraC family transcriptional regulator [Brevibacillus humidisoli]